MRVVSHATAPGLHETRQRNPKFYISRRFRSITDFLSLWNVGRITKTKKNSEFNVHLGNMDGLFK